MQRIEVKTPQKPQTYGDAFNTRMWEKSARAENYSKLGWSQNNELLSFLVDQLSLQPTDVVIDMATGNGVVAQALLERLAEVVAFDISPAMMANMKPEVAEKTQKSQASITELPYASNSADIMTARMVFHHLTSEQIVQALKEATRVLKPGGKCMVVEYVSTNEECLQVERQVFDIKEKNRQLWTANGMKSIFLEYLEEAKIKDNVSLRVSTTVLQQYSVMNWLMNANMAEQEIDKIIKLYLESSDSFKEATQMTIVYDINGALSDILMDRVFAHLIIDKKDNA